MADLVTRKLVDRIAQLEREAIRVTPGQVAQVSPLKVTFNGTTALAVTVASTTFTVGQQVNVLFASYSKPIVLPII